MNVTKYCVYPIFPTGIEKYNVKQKNILTVDSVISKRLQIITNTKEPWNLRKKNKRLNIA